MNTRKGNLKDTFWGITFCDMMQLCARCQISVLYSNLVSNLFICLIQTSHQGMVKKAKLQFITSALTLAPKHYLKSWFKVGLQTMVFTNYDWMKNHRHNIGFCLWFWLLLVWGPLNHCNKDV